MSKNWGDVVKISFFLSGIFKQASSHNKYFHEILTICSWFLHIRKLPTKHKLKTIQNVKEMQYKINILTKPKILDIIKNTVYYF